MELNSERSRHLCNSDSQAHGQATRAHAVMQVFIAQVMEVGWRLETEMKMKVEAE